MSGIWKVGTVVAARAETASARSIDIEIPDWPGNLAGQHLDLRLTAEDGYTATRSYSIATAGAGTRIQLAVDRLPDGEVSPYLVDVAEVGDQLEVRGPLGGWFVWRPEQNGAQPVQLIAGGSGIVPILSMIRAHDEANSPARFRLLYSVREPADAIFAAELMQREGGSTELDITWVYTRKTPDGWPTPAGRVTRATLAAATVPADQSPAVFVCGPTGFVEAVADILVTLGHSPDSVKTERFGGA